MHPLVRPLKPEREDRVIDCVRNADVDVTDWANFKGGARNAGRNPRYCYEWSFIEPGRTVALSLWYRDMKVARGKIVQRHNFLEGARRSEKANWIGRNRKMHRAVTTAWEDRLPVRVIVCDGLMRGSQDPEGRPSEVKARVLDPEAWAVTSLDPATGEVILTRGARAPRSPAVGPRTAKEWFPDESALPGKFLEGGRKQVTVNGIERDARARRECVRYYGHRCLVCDLLFSERYGALGQDFIHVHHLRPLGTSLKRRVTDPTKDLVPICPNCHAMLHQRTPPLSIAALRRLVRSNA